MRIILTLVIIFITFPLILLRQESRFIETENGSIPYKKYGNHEIDD